MGKIVTEIGSYTPHIKSAYGLSGSRHFSSFPKNLPMVGDRFFGFWA